MKKMLFRLLSLVVMVAFFQACEKAYIEDESSLEQLELKSANNSKVGYIVVLNDAELKQELSTLKGYEKKQAAVKSASAKILKRSGVLDGEVELVYGTAVQGFSVKIPPGQLKKLELDPAVAKVVEDKMISLGKPGSDVSAAATQTTPWGIIRVNGGVTYTGDKVAWVIDTGIDLDHPDLNVDASRGKTFVTRTSSPDDDNGHGTHCAGTIAAIDNSEGVIGVAAGATVIPVKVLDRRGSGYYSWIIGGVDYVAANADPGDVANMSLGGGYDATLNNAVSNAADNGILFALAAGNESTNAGTRSPASTEHSNVYTISAMDINNNFASFSNYGNPPVDYCEPGVSILSTYKGGAYGTMSGTSMASPHMAGLLLLGDLETNGHVNGDPDGNADPIGVFGGNVTPPDNVPPTADFTFTTAGLTATFTDTSTDSDGTVVARNWDFGDGNTSTAQNPSHTYAADGTYTVTLTVTDDKGATDNTSQSVTVSGGTTNNPPTADFTVTTNDLTAVFTDQSSDSDGSIVSWVWNFGDGNTSTAQNPNHTYEADGTYAVTLTVTDDGGATDDEIQNITVTGPAGDITLQATYRKVRGIRYVDLTWSGATGTNVSVKVNGSINTTTANDGEETINMARSSGTFTFQICETDDSACSNVVTLVL